ncbi:hypothetical protein F8388_021458 [Cannabis sativa]|uniref:Uncharacterized protein n=1 Tax=Cannabis sativa TaxID=3483 RepID=A0A7J6FDS0_CANSA|nr:hypothetical protein F8388_021458 [Cannabis sativa]
MAFLENVLLWSKNREPEFTFYAAVLPCFFAGDKIFLTPLEKCGDLLQRVIKSKKILLAQLNPLSRAMELANEPMQLSDLGCYHVRLNLEQKLHYL